MLLAKQTNNPQMHPRILKRQLLQMGSDSSQPENFFHYVFVSKRRENHFGLCFLCLINQGNDHAFPRGRDLADKDLIILSTIDEEVELTYFYELSSP